MHTTTIDAGRRRLLKSGATLAAATPFLGALQAFSIRQSYAAESLPVASPYGALHPVKDMSTDLELLQLPDGFNYKSFSWTGDAMINGRPVPPSHDGMGAVALRNNGAEIVLIRNHEASVGTAIDAPASYDSVSFTGDRRLAGGTTNLYFPVDLTRAVRTEASLGGTRTNCAGGVTPWGTWLSCEEDVSDYRADGGRKHGYVFEVSGNPEQTSGNPLVAMGRFRHEAAAVDPDSGIVYLSEDNRNSAAYYRFIPSDKSQRPGALEGGGRLQAAKIKGTEAAALLAPQLGDSHSLEWVDITDPDADPIGSESGPYRQALRGGALTISRGEGLWYRSGKIYLVDTSAGRDLLGRKGHGNGCVWMHDLEKDTLTCIFASPDRMAGNNPDNITISPRGGVLMCEDGGGVDDDFGFGERLLGLTSSGESYIFAKNNVIFSDTQAAAAGKQVRGGDYRGQEFAGACFDPTGRFLFVNIQTPGITFAIWGPWQRGPM